MIRPEPDDELRCTRFNNRSAGAITRVPFEDMPAYYRTYRRLDELIDAPDVKTGFKLRSGAFVVDNMCVLQGHSGYGGAAGGRWP